MKKLIAILITTLAAGGMILTASAQDTILENESVTESRQEADAVYTEFEVLEDSGYDVNMYHSFQGPLCEAAFALAQGQDWLVTDYFNLSINNNLNIYEIASHVRLRIKIPQELQKYERTWYMICISRNGTAYTFEDEDDSEETITFTANRMYAYAMCYTDDPSKRYEKNEEKEEVDENARSKIRSVKDSKTISGEAKEDLSKINADGADPTIFYGNKTNRLPKLNPFRSEVIKRQKEVQTKDLIMFNL